VLAFDEGSRWTILAPLAQGELADPAALVDETRRQGFTRLRVDGDVVPVEDALARLTPGERHVVELVVDRIQVKDGLRPRLTDSIETGLRYGEGVIVLLPADGGPARRMSERMRCDACGIDLPELTPQLFSFNSPAGMCPACNGLGTAIEVDPALVVPDPDKSLDDGAIAPWAQFFGDPQRGTLTGEIVDALCARYGIRRDVPWRKLTAEQQHALLYGSEEPLRFSSKRSYGTTEFELPFEGIARVIERRWRETKSDGMRDSYQDYMSSSPCRECGGSRLNEAARHVRFGDATLPTLVKTSIDALAAWFEGLTLAGKAAVVARDAVREVISRLRFLSGVGLGYLSLDRTAGTLSGGESQRIRLASQLGTELTGVLYVLDEPSIGLHPRDNERLIEALARLRDLGNSVIVVEHDDGIMRAADWVIDIGPGAGRAGGQLVAAGTAE
ncbi:MAG: excinuclease ABC subunit UvrA, partial [Myxococcales bacterium]|nr:excinuclease ABC subunit UvrA [Myxococcales bacterium]